MNSKKLKDMKIWEMNVDGSISKSVIGEGIGK
jgi:hypothetical protein